MVLFVGAAMCPIFFASNLGALQMQMLGSRDTFRAAGLSSAEVKEIVKQVEESAYDIADEWESELRVRRVDLGESPGVILQGTKLLCGATGNCQTWVFRKALNGWMLMFAKDDVPIADGFRLGPAVSHGIKDLIIQANSSAEAVHTITYKFDGKLYRAK